MNSRNLEMTKLNKNEFSQGATILKMIRMEFGEMGWRWLRRQFFTYSVSLTIQLISLTHPYSVQLERNTEKGIVSSRYNTLNREHETNYLKHTPLNKQNAVFSGKQLNHYELAPHSSITLHKAYAFMGKEFYLLGHHP